MPIVDPYFFGAGTLTLVPPGVNATPVQVGILQDVDVEISSSTKELHGADMFPVAIATTKGKISGKAKSGSLNGGLANAIMTGGVVTAGRPIGTEENIIVAGGGATVAHAAEWAEDLGVLDLTAGLALKKVDSGPGAGEYSVAAGVYDFSGNDGNTVVIRYTYTDTSGSTVAFTNQPMGRARTFVVQLFNETNDEHIGIKIWAAIFSKLTFPFKNEDFAMNDLAFEGQQDGQRRTWDYYTPSVIPPTV